MLKKTFCAVIPAAGIGTRVGAARPKQYLSLLDKTIIEHSLLPFLAHPLITRVVVSLANNDQWFTQLDIAQHPKIETVIGGEERVDSVLSALSCLDPQCYVLVHDAARPCVHLDDINKLIKSVDTQPQGAILATKVRDTMKRSGADGHILRTVEREHLWHALTPQIFLNKQLTAAIKKSHASGKITDEASALELLGSAPFIVEGRADNLKITREEDLQLATFYLSQGENR